ncbi:MAG: FecR domain-containing protein [Pseudomonadota bacterium]
MNHHPQKPFAISRLGLCLVALCVTPALAGTAVGTVTRVSGPLLLKRADGAIKAIALNSFVEQGDTLVTEKNTYAQLKFADDSEITLKPDTQLKIEVLVYNAVAAENPDTVFSMTQGAVQIRTGAAPKSKPENIKLVMPNLLDPLASAVVDRKAGTTFITEYIAGSAESQLASLDARHIAARYPAVLLASAESAYRSDAPAFSLPKNWDTPQLLAQNTPRPPGMPAPAKAPGLPAGLYVSVIDGAINLSNKGGSQSFTAGQFGYTASITRPPVVVPANPGLKFTPPPTFSSNSGSSGAAGGNKAAAVDCVVR